MGDSNKSPSTRSLIADAEKLRGGKTSRTPKTKQLIAESEKLIGREGAPTSNSGRTVIVGLAFVAVLLALAVWFWLS
ncbi:MAG: hypothetical protein A2341_19410 [Deltaproteobacteria bacterium RIFOXYB12_FULL_58_9]|nr:MAG: hypothetical protein A2341_19410 [Deltaproteobacteria bacterium RIFOXYB12_FULL_58_9]